MKVEVTHRGVHKTTKNGSVEAEIGEIIDLPKDTEKLPAYLVNKVRVLAVKPPKAKAVTNDKKAADKKAADKKAADNE